MERWMEHYLELYLNENTVSEEALNSIQFMPIVVELDSEPTSSEIEKAINGLATGKAPGYDAILSEVIKQRIPVLLPTYINFFRSAGENVKYIKTCVMPRLSHYSRIKVIAVIVTIIVELAS